MNTSGIRIFALSLGIAMVGIASPGAAGGTNWAREHVRQWEDALLKRVLGERATTAKVRPQIIGGEAAPDGKWPFQAALLYVGFGQYCGASVVEPLFILTAAHCVDFVTPGQIRVLTNTQSLDSGGVKHKVARIKIHPRYDSVTADYDVAVIMLKTEVTGAPVKNPVQIITGAEEDTLAAPKTKAFVTGWGDVDPDANGESYPNDLQQVVVPLVSRGRCNQPQSYAGEVTGRMVCAGFTNGGKDSCQGDSGGPLTVKNADGRWRTLVGIVSWGTGCAEPLYFGVYSRLAVLGTWVHAVIGTMSSPAAAAVAACESARDRTSPSCLRSLTAEADSEMAAYLDTIRRLGSAEQIRGAETEQAAWTQSRSSLCAFDAATNGAAGTEACFARETRKRADTLAGQLAELAR